MLIKAQSLANAGETEQAKALYQQLIREYPDTVYAGHAYLGLAKVHVALRENEEALAALDQVLENFSRPALVGAAAVQKVTVLIHRFSMYDEAIQLAEEQLEALGEYMQPFDRRVMVIQLTYAYDKAGQTEKALATYEELLPGTPALLTLPLYFERLFELQTKLAKQDEALTTARLGYALCAFEQTAIEAMSNLVKKAYASRGEIFKATQFFAAQEDPEKPNPLAEVPMPEVSEEQLAQMLEIGAGDCRLEVCSYLYAGRYEEAMMAAQEAMAAAPAEDMLRALGEVARVFKAKDLNLVRANQFLNYAKTGEGENPLAGFWEEAE
jgi:tetratricopeptide (TPR) repeat protein